MKRALIAGCSALFLIGSAHADTTTKFEAAIDVDRSETNPIVSIRAIERQAGSWGCSRSTREVPTPAAVSPAATPSSATSEPARRVVAP